MSSDVAIAVRGVGKAYTIRHQDEHHITLAESMLSRVRHPFQRQEKEQFWALQDVSFDVKQGEVLGIIGRNGAGKSTLLKILSRITAPTTGSVELYGRVGSLLEVGTGFHPELTGRENVYLNGAILGMRKSEIDRQFDEIVDFAGVEKFLDTPVKRYSSGMYVRLAFAVAAHLRTEILIVDEVLAVGDAEFQKKCLGKMGEVAQDGRTVLLVSHQLAMIRAQATQALLLVDGALLVAGPPEDALEIYATATTKGSGVGERGRSRGGSGQLRFTWAAPSKPTFDPDEPKRVAFQIAQERALSLDVFISAMVRNSDGRVIADCDSSTVGVWYPAGQIAGEFSLVSPWLLPDTYEVDLVICQAGVIDFVESACAFDVIEALPYPSPPSQEALRRDLVLPNYRFERASKVAESTVLLDGLRS